MKFSAPSSQALILVLLLSAMAKPVFAELPVVPAPDGVVSEYKKPTLKSYYEGYGGVFKTNYNVYISCVDGFTYNFLDRGYKGEKQAQLITMEPGHHKVCLHFTMDSGASSGDVVVDFNAAPEKKYQVKYESVSKKTTGSTLHPGIWVWIEDAETSEKMTQQTLVPLRSIIYVPIR